jgi:hypothetical protein
VKRWKKKISQRFYILFTLKVKTQFYDAKKFKNNLNILEQSFIDQWAIENDQIAPTTKATIFFTQEQNSNFIVVIHSKLCRLLRWKAQTFYFLKFFYILLYGSYKI